VQAYARAALSKQALRRRERFLRLLLERPPFKSVSVITSSASPPHHVCAGGRRRRSGVGILVSAALALDVSTSYQLSTAFLVSSSRRRCSVEEGLGHFVGAPVQQHQHMPLTYCPHWSSLPADGRAGHSRDDPRPPPSEEPSPSCPLADDRRGLPQPLGRSYFMIVRRSPRLQ